MDPFKNTLQTIEVNIHEKKTTTTMGAFNRRLVNRLKEIVTKGTVLEGCSVEFKVIRKVL